MFTLKIASLSLIVTAGLLAVPAFAETAAIPSFRSIELSAYPAAMVDDVRAGLAARLPAGSSIDDARALLRGSGAHCRVPKADGGMRCRYNDIHMQDDIMQDVSWTVDFRTADDKVASFTVARDPASD
ncbi:hypothetical protein [Sphingomonas nostoxanthinifaciens]|uniref:hypothetical protein n=1 Tax=Sphingomonas nostoxanthinifaciens TaxID=2872652 RepID=UPI001CC1F19D|nr:hypothetical protein [Sphingomonas nostoxanthinifaciens]UAK23096.1 hypothetical protein K8P63_11760 [Sphingomonas nostoxanthinifaciens]